MDFLVAERFWSRVERTDTCWLWKGWLDEKSRRGRFVLNGIHMTAPRAAWIIMNGPLADDLVIMHTCDNPPCVRPDHLKPGTHQENMDDMSRKKRAPVYQHPHRYRNRPRNPNAKTPYKYRPIKQPDAPKGIDRTTWSRFSTEEEKALARWALETLETQHNRIGLVPAPDPHHTSHMIRVQAESNPEWYREYASSYWRGNRQLNLKRSRVEKALQRVVKGKVRGNGYEVDLLGHLKNWMPVQAAETVSA